MNLYFIDRLINILLVDFSVIIVKINDTLTGAEALSMPSGIKRLKCHEQRRCCFKLLRVSRVSGFLGLQRTTVGLLGMVILVGDDKIAPAHQRRDDAHIGLVAGGKDQCRFRPHELGQPPLQFQVQLQRAIE